MRIHSTDAAVHAVVELLFDWERIVRKDVDTRGNIFSIFFHELVIHFSGILIQRETSTPSSSEVTFPFVNHQYASQPYLQNLISDYSAKKETSVIGVLHQMRVLPVARGEAIPFGYRQQRSLSRLINFVTEYQKPTWAFILQADRQQEALRNCIATICREHSIEGGAVITKNWDQYWRLHCTEQLRSTRHHTLIIGNRQNLQNRKLAHNFFEQEKTVVGFTHGEISSTIFTEPLYRYAERGVCTHLVEYGQPQEKQSGSVILPPAATLYRTSSLAKSVYRSSQQISSREISGSKILYIPTTYVGDYIYGPSHAYPDKVYAEWHNTIQQAIPSIVFKKHPKSHVFQPYPGATEKRWLDDCIEEYDCYVLDYVATSTVRAMLTDKPVIYLDIGLRPLTDQFLKVLKKRCFYWKIDINGDLAGQMNEAIAEFCKGGHCGSNLDIAKYCVANTPTFSWRETLFG